MSFLNFEKRRNKRYRYINRPYILNAEKRVLRGNLYTYRLRYLQRHLEMFPSNFFFYIYFNKLKRLKRYFKRNSVNKYYTYIIKHIHIKYFKHNNFNNFKSKVQYRLNIEERY